jgi:hypothetical protein
MSGLGQAETETGTVPGEKLVRNLDQHTRAIAGFGIAAGSAPVSEIDQDLDTLQNDVMRTMAFYAGHKTDATGIVFVTGMVEALRFRKTGVPGKPGVGLLGWKTGVPDAPGVGLLGWQTT